MYSEECAIAIYFCLLLNVQVFHRRRLFPIEKVAAYMKKTKDLLAITSIQVEILSCDSWVSLLLLEAR